MKRPIIVLLFLLIMECSIVMGTIDLATANALFELGDVPPDASTKPPTIAIFSPTNNTVYNNTAIILNVNVSLPQSTTASGTILYSVSFACDWLKNSTLLYSNDGYYDVESQFPHPQFFNGSIELSDIPDGNHTITVTARAGGFYPGNAVGYPSGINGFYRFTINGTSNVLFSTSAYSPISSKTQTSNSLSNPIALLQLLL